MFIALKIILGLHYVLAPTIAYYYLRENFDWWVATPFALLFLTPMTLFVGHYEKVLGWPWIVFAVLQLRPTRLRADPRRAGLLAGIGLGIAFLAGDNYHVFYAGLLSVSILLATRTREAFIQFFRGGLVATPKLLFSVFPVILLGADRPDSGRGLTLDQFVTGIIGFWFDTNGGGFVFSQKLYFEGFAAVGLPILLLAFGVILWSYVDPHEHWRWVGGVVSAILVGTLLATRWEIAYQMPVVEMFRVAARAIVMVSLSVLLLGWLGLWLTQRNSRAAYVAAAALITLSAANGVVAWSEVENREAIDDDFGREVAADIDAMDCGPVWIEGGYDGSSTPKKKMIGYHLTERGIPLQAASYGKIGQNYTAVKNGSLTFDVLLIGGQLPDNESVTLTGGWYAPDRGTINTSGFNLEQTYQTGSRTLYVYTHSSACGG
jgi:hypothetical protein